MSQSEFFSKTFTIIIDYLLICLGKTRNGNKYLASDCPLAGKHLKQLEQDSKILNDEALHPIELLAKSYRL